jgi:alkylation response protein AidB-like acyl-CoA dehydrogenase
MRVIEEISRADGSAGWTLMIGASTGMILASLPEHVSRELMNGDPDTIGAGSLAPAGKAVPVEGGYRVSGRWPFTSGCRHAKFYINGCIVFDGERPRMSANGLPVALLAVLPAADCKILDNWYVSGLRGTGSNDTAVQDYFVPEERTALWFNQQSQPRRTETLYRFPPIAFLAVEVAPVALGIARAAIETLVELASAKTPTGAMSLLRERSAVQTDVAKAEALVRSARAFLYDTVQEAWDLVDAGTELSLEQRALLRLAATNAVRASAEAVDLMYEAGGATSIYQRSLLERCFRDVHALTQHIIIQPPTYEMAGKVFLGVDLGPALL